MHVDKFIKSSKKGFGFCDVIFGWDSSDELYELKNESEDDLYTGWHSGFPDAKVNIVPNPEESIHLKRIFHFFWQNWPKTKYVPGVVE